MKKRDKIIYWIATIWLSLGMMSTGIVQLIKMEDDVNQEWAYAGFFFAMSGAVFSHLVSGNGATELFGPALLLILTAVSWYFRPADRKLIESADKSGI